MRPVFRKLRIASDKDWTARSVPERSHNDVLSVKLFIRPGAGSVANGLRGAAAASIYSCPARLALLALGGFGRATRWAARGTLFLAPNPKGCAMKPLAQRRSNPHQQTASKEAPVTENGPRGAGAGGFPACACAATAGRLDAAAGGGEPAHRRRSDLADLHHRGQQQAGADCGHARRRRAHVDLAAREAEQAAELGIPAVATFPNIDMALRTRRDRTSSTLRTSSTARRAPSRRGA